MKHAAHAAGRRGRQRSGQGGRLRYRAGTARGGDTAPSSQGDASRSGQGDAARSGDREGSRSSQGDAARSGQGDAARSGQGDAARSGQGDAARLGYGGASRPPEASPGLSRETGPGSSRETGPGQARQDAADGPAGRGGGRRYAQLSYWVVLGVVALGLLLSRGGDGQALRGGTFVIAGALLAGSVIRLALPEGRAGMLGSRRRLADVAVLTVLGIGLLIAGLTLSVPG